MWGGSKGSYGLEDCAGYLLSLLFSSYRAASRIKYIGVKKIVEWIPVSVQIDDSGWKVDKARDEKTYIKQRTIVFALEV